MANVSLTKHQEQFIQRKVKSGRYLSSSEVVREGLRLLEEADHIRDERLEALRRDIAVGTHQLKEGKVVIGAAAFRKARKSVQKRSVSPTSVFIPRRRINFPTWSPAFRSPPGEWSTTVGTYPWGYSFAM